MMGPPGRLKELLVAHNSNMSGVHAILDSEGFDANVILDPEHGYTALQCAVRVYSDSAFERLEVVRKLLRLGALVAVADFNGNTALHYAATYNYKRSLARELLKAGADPLQTNHAGHSPYDIAFNSGASLIVDDFEHKDDFREIAAASPKPLARMLSSSPMATSFLAPPSPGSPLTIFGALSAWNKRRSRVSSATP